MSVYNHRPMVPAAQSRIVELLEAIRAEFDQLSQEAMICKSQRDDLEHKSKAILLAGRRYHATVITYNSCLCSKCSDPGNERIPTKLIRYGENAKDS
jgi:hypothetical protein